MTRTVIEIFPESRLLIAAAGDRVVATISAALAVRGRAHIVLTGGGNGIALLRHLSAYGQHIDWSQVHLYWGDERYVPANDDERNDKQARTALLDHISIPAGNVHVMPASDDAFGEDLAAAARAYQQELAAAANAGEQTPEFDLHLLGMGPEGHINSLFPGSLAVQENVRMVVGVDDSPKPPSQRITLTLKAIQRCREVCLMVSGAEKADAVAAAVAGADPVALPAAGATGRETTRWLLDTAAARKLPSPHS